MKYLLHAVFAASVAAVAIAAVVIYMPRRPAPDAGPLAGLEPPAPDKGAPPARPEEKPPVDATGETPEVVDGVERPPLRLPAVADLTAPPRVPHLAPATWPTITFAAAPPTRVPPHPERLALARLSDASEADLRAELESAPEVSLYTVFTEAQAKALEADTRKGRALPETIPPRFIGRPDLAGLPMLKGASCKLSAPVAAELEANSTSLRTAIRASASGRDPDARTLSTVMERGADAELRWTRAAAIPALQQMLMAEEAPARRLLIRQLSKIEGRWASMALAQRAITDLDPALRELALQELRKRPAEGYLGVLMAGLSYPWPAVARHSAEALSSLRRTEAVPGLLALLGRPDPSTPYTRGKGQYVREMVKVNHHRNCLLCHAIATDPKEPVRGRVPTTDKAFPPTYYQARDGVFVRADVTYLRQDFSMTTSVKDPGPWPERQRFDFLTRERPARKGETGPSPGITTPHQKAILHALTSLTGKDHGPDADAWRKLYLGRELHARTLSAGLTAGKALAIDRGRAIILDGSLILVKEGKHPPKPLFEMGPELFPLAHIAADGNGGLLATSESGGRVVRIAEGKNKLLAKGLTAPRRVIPDGAGGAYVVEAALEGRAAGGGVHHVPADGPVKKLPVPLRQPRAIALSPDGGRLYVASAAGHDILSFAVEAPGKLGEGVRLTPPERTGPGRIVELMVSDEGDICVIDSAHNTLEVINAAGARLASASLPEGAVAGAVHGTTAYALTATALVEVPLAHTPLRALTTVR